MEYTTQMDAARKGIITKEMEIAAKKRKHGCQRINGIYGKRPGYHSL